MNDNTAHVRIIRRIRRILRTKLIIIIIRLLRQTIIIRRGHTLMIRGITILLGIMIQGMVIRRQLRIIINIRIRRRNR